MNTTMLRTDDEPLLIARLREHDSAALEGIYRLHASRVFTTALRIVVDRQAAEDVTQEVFLFLWRHAEDIDPNRGGLSSFLVTLARRRAIDVVRQEENRRRRQLRAANGYQPIGCELVAPDIADELVARDTTARAAVAVRSALDELPKTQLVAIELAYFGGRTLREVAVATHSPEGTAKSRVRRGLRHLEHILVAQAPSVGKSEISA
jgi:RNA polymerase sigma factor (sigma-70 family)